MCPPNGSQILVTHAVITPLKDTSENTSIGPPQRLDRYGRVLERLIRRHQEEPLLRIHAVRLGARDAEEPRVKLRNVLLEKIPVPGDRGLLRLRVRVEPLVGVPSGPGNLRVAAAALGEELPQLVQVRGSAGELAADAHDGDRRRRGAHSGAVGLRQTAITMVRVKGSSVERSGVSSGHAPMRHDATHD